MDNLVVLQVVLSVVLGMMTDSLLILELYKNKRRRRRLNGERSYSLLSKIPKQIEHLSDLVVVSDSTCIFQLRLNRNEIDKKGERKELFEKVKLLPMSITPDEQLKAALAIANHQKSVDVFFGLPVEFQCDLVRLALADLLT